METKVSIIYVNYRTAAMTVKSIESVYKYCGAECQIIVVDNNSDDHIEQQLSPYPNITLIKSPSNLGFGRANNLGVKHATGQYLLFLNTDTELLNDAPLLMASYLDTHSDVGAVGANLYKPDGSPNQSFLYCHSIWSDIRNFMPKTLKRNHYAQHQWFNESDKPRNVGYISGAAVMIRHRWANENGAFDPDFFMYFEDMELSQRVRKSGLSVVNLPQAHIMHIGGASSDKKQNNNISIKRYQMLCESKYIYFSKVFSHRYAKLDYFINTTLHGIYILFAPSRKRQLHKEMQQNNREAYKNFKKTILI